MKRYLPLVIVGVVFVAALGTGTALYRARSRPVIVLKGEPGAEPAHAHGALSAAVLLEEFGDFQCPPCATLTPIIDSLERDYGRKLRVIFRNFPLATHKNAAAAARAVEAAGLQGKFWEMHHLLYQTQSAWHASADPRPIFDNNARKIGLDVSRFKADMDSANVTALVAADRRRATSLGVTGTPTVFVNNERVQATSVTAAPFRAAVEAALHGK